MQVKIRKDMKIRVDPAYNKPRNKQDSLFNVDSISNLSYDRATTYTVVNKKTQESFVFAKKEFYAPRCTFKEFIQQRDKNEPFEKVNIFKELQKEFKIFNLDLETSSFSFDATVRFKDNDNVLCIINCPHYYENNKNFLTTHDNNVYEVIFDHPTEHEGIAASCFSAFNILSTLNPNGEPKGGYSNFSKRQNFKSVECYIVGNRTASFDLMTQLEGYTVGITARDLAFLKSLTGTTYQNEDFTDVDSLPKHFVLIDNNVEIPILENFDNTWVFYKHNLEKHQDVIVVS